MQVSSLVVRRTIVAAATAVVATSPALAQPGWIGAIMTWSGSEREKVHRQVGLIPGSRVQLRSRHSFHGAVDEMVRAMTCWCW